MSLIDSEALPRRTMHLFFVVDTSGSMRGEKIGAVNDAIRNVLPIVRDISNDKPDAEIKVAALNFSDGCEWLCSEAKNAEDFEWIDQTAAGGTDLGEACRNIEKVLHQKNGWMGSGSGSYAPVFILLSDGGATDDFDSGVAALWKNKWFIAGIKVAIAIGNDADTDALAKFTGNIERVIRVHDVENLKKVIRIVAVTSTQIGSSSGSTPDGGKDVKKEEEATKAIGEQLAEENVEIGAEINNTYSDDDF